jgi:hypothetical protein
MAYIKYKELTKYFNFNKEIDIESLPSYVTDYLRKNEKIIKAYRTRRDKAIFTNTRMILFDINFLKTNRKIHIIPYNSISTAVIAFKPASAFILISFDSGYQMRLNFVNMGSKDKTELRKLYSYIMDIVS